MEKTREIKFRAWHKQKREMILPDGKFPRWVTHYGILTMRQGGFDLTDPEELEIMQYTGLKDKNGKEIYDGDIVKTNSGHICEIRWCKVQERSNGDEFAYTGFALFNISQNAAFHLDSDPLEIIGNIYEHPHLLTK